MLDVTSRGALRRRGGRGEAQQARKFLLVSGSRAVPASRRPSAHFSSRASLYWRGNTKAKGEQAAPIKANAETSHAPAFIAFAVGFALLTAGLGLLIYRIVHGADVDAAAALPAGARLAPGEHGPYRLSLPANYALGLIALVWGSSLGFIATLFFRDRITAGLPDPRKLEEITYKVVIAGWPLLTIGIVMGGMWANEAWGRFWGWDPKETWALITWVVYAGYLHTRITLGWAGKRPAAIAVFAFAVVVFTFMGVNLGLTGEGLHTYGAG